MNDKENAKMCLRRALNAAEQSVLALRKAIDYLERGDSLPAPSQEDLGLSEQMRGVIKSKGRA